MPEIPAALRAQLDQELAAATQSVLNLAADLDGEDIIEANGKLTILLLISGLTYRQLATAAAMMALRATRSKTPTAGLPAKLRTLAAECRTKAQPLAGRAVPEGIRLHAQAEAYDRAALLAEGGESA